MGTLDSIKKVFKSERQDSEKTIPTTPHEPISHDVQSANNGKTLVYNLIIVDESGSMGGLREATLSGINETINTIREAQKEFDSSQKHFLTLVTFDERGRDIPSVRTIIDAKPITSVYDFTDYFPTGCTPLYDAIGISLTKLRNKISDDEDATGVVTILTDGLENASTQWKADALRRLINQLKEEGWTFSYMGSAHDVKEVTDLLSIDNIVEFSHDTAGASNTWEHERSSRHMLYCKMAIAHDIEEDLEERRERRRQYSQEYYTGRVTPYHIDKLESNEIFVFGSNPAGIHAGGAAKIALDKFGAEWKNGEGIQGQSYAIPTTDGMQLMKEAVEDFISFAKEHPEYRFLVTRIGCGISGYQPSAVAPLFKDAIELENVTLPKDFWEVLGLKML